MSDWRAVAPRLRKKDKALERVERDLRRLRPEVGHGVQAAFDEMIVTVRAAREYAPRPSNRQASLTDY